MEPVLTDQLPAESRPRPRPSGRSVGSYRFRAAIAAMLAVMLVAAGCTESKSGANKNGDDGASSDVGPVSASDLAKAGLWSEPACKSAGEPLKVGIQTTFASPVITAHDQVFALQAAAKAFNARGGANGHCIQVVACDEKADPNQALNCTHTLDRDGVAVTINDTSTATPGPEVGKSLGAAGIARFAIGSATPDLTDSNAYPIDAGGIGTAMVMPQALINKGIKKIATIRVDLPAASAIIGLFQDIYSANGAKFVADIPVPGGTTDYSQFVLAAQDAGATGAILPLGGQEAIQVLRAAQQLDSKLVFSTSLGTLPYKDMAALGDYADHVILNGSIAPATVDLPAMKVLESDWPAPARPNCNRRPSSPPQPSRGSGSTRSSPSFAKPTPTTSVERTSPS